MEYKTQKLFDPTFGIHPKAMAVAQLLGELEIKLDHIKDPELRSKINHLIDVRTFPFYNGREHGICIMTGSLFNIQEAQFIVFGEHRNSDSIFVDVWKAKRPFNNPDVSMFPDEAYKKRRFFYYNHINETAVFVRDAVEDYIKEMIDKELEKAKM